MAAQTHRTPEKGSILSLTPTGCEHRESIMVTMPDGVRLGLDVVAYGVVVVDDDPYCTNVEPLVATPTGWNTVSGAIGEYDDGAGLEVEHVKLIPEADGKPRWATWHYMTERWQSYPRSTQ